MKMRKILAMACAMALTAAIAVGGTLAYLTSTTDEVVNTFTVGNVAITLDEAKVDPETGAALIDGGRVQANSYKLMPGHTYVKDPTVHVTAGSEDCYVRMFVKIENYDTLLEKMGTDALPEEFADWNKDYWACESYVMDGDNAVLEFRHDGIVTDQSEIPALFESITLPGTVTDLTGLENVKIKVTAEAIQADGFADADAAFNALNTQKG